MRWCGETTVVARSMTAQLGVDLLAEDELDIRRIASRYLPQT
jgi:hypothetical protein